MNTLVEILFKQLNDNLGNRLTPALCNGILLEVKTYVHASAAATQTAPPEAPPEVPQEPKPAKGVKT